MVGSRQQLSRVIRIKKDSAYDPRNSQEVVKQPSVHISSIENILKNTWSMQQRSILMLATCGHLRPLAATCGHSSGCERLRVQVAANGRSKATTVTEQQQYSLVSPFCVASNTYYTHRQKWASSPRGFCRETGLSNTPSIVSITSSTLSIAQQATLCQTKTNTLAARFVDGIQSRLMMVDTSWRKCVVRWWISWVAQ